MVGVKSIEFLNDCVRVRYICEPVGDGVAKPYGMSDSIRTDSLSYESMSRLPSMPERIGNSDIYRIDVPRRGTIVYIFDEKGKRKNVGPFFEAE